MSEEEKKIQEEKRSDEFETAFEAALSATPSNAPEPEPEGDEPKKDEEDKPREESPSNEDSDDFWKTEAERLKKMVEDNKSFATRMAQENAELKKRFEATPGEQQPEKKPRTEVDEIPEKLKAFYEDYPEVKDAIHFEAQRLLQKSLGSFDPGQITQRQQELEASIAQSAFDRVVMGGYIGEDGTWVDGHPDALRIMAMDGKAVESFVKERFNRSISDVGDPKEAIRIFNDYKAMKADKAAKAKDEEQKQKAREMIDMASGAIQSGTKDGASGSSSRKANDFDSAFEEAIKGLN